MAATNRSAPKPHDRGLQGFDEGDQMPYRTPRGAVEGPRRALHITQFLAVMLVVVLFLAVAYMAKMRWG
jgi:hypothetical protein